MDKSVDNFDKHWTNTGHFLDEGWTNTGLNSFLWTKCGQSLDIEKDWTNHGQTLDKVWTLRPGFVLTPVLHQHPKFNQNSTKIFQHFILVEVRQFWPNIKFRAKFCFWLSFGFGRSRVISFRSLSILANIACCD